MDCLSRLSNSPQQGICAQAKANATKYTGVSSDDLKSGGFGANTSGFGSSMGSTFGLSRKYSGGLGSSGLGSTSGFGSSSRSYHDYDEPYDSVRSLSHLPRRSVVMCRAV